MASSEVSRISNRMKKGLGLGEVVKYSKSLPKLPDDNKVCVVRQRQGTGRRKLVPRPPPTCSYFNPPCNLTYQTLKELGNLSRVVFALASTERDIREGRKINKGESNGTSRDKNTKEKKKETEATFLKKT